MAFSTLVGRRAFVALFCVGLSGCYDTDPMPVADIGRRGSEHALALAPIDAAPRQANDPVLEGPVQHAAQSQPQQGATEEFAAVAPTLGAPPSTLNEQAARLRQTENPTDPPPTEVATDEGEVDMDKAFGFSGGQDAASAGTPQIAEGDVDAPVVAGVGTGDLRDVSSRRSIPPQAAIAATPPQREQQVAYIPRFSNPTTAPESEGGMSANERSCRQQLERLNVGYREIDPIDGGPHCGIAHPIELQSINGVRILPAAKLNCAMALTFTRWVRDDLVPTARVRYFSGVKAIRQLSSYSCRPMNSKPGNPWSEHARGNAIDIGQIILNNGDAIDVRKPGFFSFRQKGLLNSVRADSCKYFNTVLGPGDPYHGDHFHFDLRSRKSGRRYCSLD